MEAGFRAKADETGGARLRAVAPFAAVALIAYPLGALDTNPVNLDDVALSLAIAVGVLAAMLWADWSRLPRIAATGVAYSYVISVVLLREGTGGGQSGFAVLLMLPVLWVALYGERWEVFAVVGGVAVAMAAPILVIGAPEYSTTEWRKLALLVGVCGVVGWAVKSLVDRLHAALEVQARETANLGRLAALNRTIAAAADSETARDAICAAVLDLSEATVAALWEPAPDQRLEVTATSDPGLRAASVATDQHHSGVAQAFREGQNLFSADAIRRFPPRFPAGGGARAGRRAVLAGALRGRAGRRRDDRVEASGARGVPAARGRDGDAVGRGGDRAGRGAATRRTDHGRCHRPAHRPSQQALVGRIDRA